MEYQLNKVEFINANKNWVIHELETLIVEWEEWRTKSEQITDHEYDRNTQAECYADGEENIEQYEILQSKTLTFLNNNLIGHGFITGFDGNSIDRNDLRIKHRVKHRLKELKILQASLKYAIVPDSYLKKKAKEITEKIIEKGSEAGVTILMEYLKNPQ